MIDYNRLFNDYLEESSLNWTQEAIETLCQYLELKENMYDGKNRVTVVALMGLAHSKLANKKISEVYSEFKKEHSNLKIEDYRPIGNYKLQIWLEDGSIMHYDYLRERLYEAEDCYLP